MRSSAAASSSWQWCCQWQCRQSALRPGRVVSALLGLFWLSTVPLTSTLVGIFFGTQWMSMLFGFVFLSHQLGSFVGLWLAGVLYDQTKSYDMMGWISIAMALFAALVHLPIREKPVERIAAPAIA